MKKKPSEPLPRREREVLDAVFALQNRATAENVRAHLAHPPSYSAVRTLLRILENKGHVRHEQDGARYVYLPTVAHDAAKRSALRHLLNTFFEGSTTQAIAALLDDDASRISNADLDRLSVAIKRARKEGA